MGEIKVKDASVLAELMVVPYKKNIITLVTWVDAKFGSTTITSAFRLGNKGVHGRCRGIDLRIWDYADPQAVVDAVNEAWIYDPERPEMMCAILHDAGSGNHIHLQVHPNTVLRHCGAS